MTDKPLNPEAQKELEAMEKLVEKQGHISDEVKRRRKEFINRYLSAIVDEKPTPSQAHALAVYIKALETAVNYYVQFGQVPQRLDVEKYKNDDAWRGLMKLWGIGGSPSESEADF